MGKRVTRSEGRDGHPIRLDGFKADGYSNLIPRFRFGLGLCVTLELQAA